MDKLYGQKVNYRLCRYLTGERWPCDVVTAATHGNTATGKKGDQQAASLLESTLFLEQLWQNCLCLHRKQR